MTVKYALDDTVNVTYASGLPNVSISISVMSPYFLQIPSYEFLIESIFRLK